MTTSIRRWVEDERIGAVLDEYVDEGCSESAACLACPLPVCRYDDPAWYQKLLRYRRDIERVELIRKHKSVSGAARSLGQDPRTMHRAGARLRAGVPVPR